MSENVEAFFKQVATLKAELATKGLSLKQMQVQYQTMEASIGALQQTLTELEEKINELAGQPQEALATADKADKPSAIINEEPYPEQRLKTFVALRVLEEERERLLPHVHMIRNSDFFDADWYMQTYPDVKESGYAKDPAMHYLLFGGFEGRHPGPLFNSKAYYLEHSDVYYNQGNPWNPLLHFIVNGISEGRIVYPVAKK